jgi:hypothetical protein
MAITTDITNSLRSRSVIRVVNTAANDNTVITLSSLSANSALETISQAAITQVISTSNTGRWKIYRGDNASGVLIMTVGDGADFPLSQYDISIANTPTANIFVTNTGTDGTLILQLTKTATYPAGVLTGY